MNVNKTFLYFTRSKGKSYKWTDPAGHVPEERKHDGYAGGAVFNFFLGLRPGRHPAGSGFRPYLADRQTETDKAMAIEEILHFGLKIENCECLKIVIKINYRLFSQSFLLRDWLRNRPNLYLFWQGTYIAGAAWLHRGRNNIYICKLLNLLPERIY